VALVSSTASAGCSITSSTGAGVGSGAASTTGAGVGAGVASKTYKIEYCQYFEF
jgi:hypothetical protein